jgi:hypothetical protein
MTDSVREIIAERIEAFIELTNSEYMERADAILAALADAGYVVVPKEPTEVMLADACMTYRHDYGLLSDEEKGRQKATCSHWWLGVVRAAQQGDDNGTV